jgi:hypothetical protein
VALTTNSVSPEYAAGVRATVGYLCDDAAIELTGFYQPETRWSSSVFVPGSLGMGFINAPPQFQGLSGSLWVPADSAGVSLREQLGDAELNYRWWSRAFSGFEGIIGFRYFEMDERAAISVDDSFTGAATGSAAPAALLQANYVARVNNHMLLAQTGFEWNQCLYPWLSAGVMFKAAGGADDIEVTRRLTLGTGFVGTQGRASNWTWSTLYEVDAFLDFVALEKMRIRAGYMAMWVMHVGEGFQQVQYDLAVQSGPVRDSGSVFFHGPMIEVQFLF